MSYILSAKIKIIATILGSLFCFSGVNATPTVWDVLRNQFKLNHQSARPEVQKQIRWIAKHPHYIHKLANNSRPYIYYVISQIKKHKMPGELALLPMIESAYDPFAYSSAGAAGLWQLMPGTGSGLGITQDWWYDGRRSVTVSTLGALTHLKYLNKYFKGDWVLALAAYDSGEGTIRRAIRKSKQQRRSQVHFWSLNIPRETQNYIPRLMAIAEIIKYHKYYNIQLPDIPYKPHFEEVDVGSQIELNIAAQMANMKYRDFIKLNPGYNRWTTSPNKPHTVLIPKNNVRYFKEQLSKITKSKRVNWKQHKVQKGESLSTIAQKHHTTITLLKELNQLKTSTLVANTRLLIPAIQPHRTTKKQRINRIDRTNPSRHYKVIHVFQKNDSLKKIEQRYNVKPGQIFYWNQIKNKKSIKVGAQLIIWKKSKQATHTLKSYKVKTGDTLGAIAKKHHTTIRALQIANPKLMPNKIRIGQTLKV